MCSLVIALRSSLCGHPSAVIPLIINILLLFCSHFLFLSPVAVNAQQEPALATEAKLVRVEITDESSQKRSLDLESNSSIQFLLGGIVAYGDTQQTMTRTLELRNFSDTQLKISGFEAGCGCSTIEAKSRIIEVGESTSVTIEYSINPKYSVPKKNVVSKVFLEGGFSISIVASIFSFPIIRPTNSNGVS